MDDYQVSEVNITRTISNDPEKEVQRTGKDLVNGGFR